MFTESAAGLGWENPRTPLYYEEFFRRHTRYQEANDQLIRAARIAPGMRILDVGAGTGRTAEAALPLLGAGEILCVEPAAPMRLRGVDRLNDPRVRWAAGLPDSPPGFDRILWGAGIWQESPLEPTIRRLASMLNAGGALCFNIPSLYLGISDEPGGGRDPLLLELPALLTPAVSLMRWEGEALPDPDGIDTVLIESGLAPKRASFQIRITQQCLREWLSIPVMTDRLYPNLHAEERAQRIRAAYEQVDPYSWKWEGWMVWAAWKPA